MSLEDEIKELNKNIKELINMLSGFSKTEIMPIKNKLIPVSSWNKFHEWPKIGGLRHYIFFAKTNGANIWIKRVGRKILIDEEAFFEWVKSNNTRYAS
jgi:hypothetical protein